MCVTVAMWCVVYLDVGLFHQHHGPLLFLGGWRPLSHERGGETGGVSFGLVHHAVADVAVHVPLALGHCHCAGPDRKRNT